MSKPAKSERSASQAGRSESNPQNVAGDKTKCVLANPGAEIEVEKLSELTHTPVPELAQMAKSGYFPVAKSGRYDLDKAIRGWFKHYGEQKEEAGGLPSYDSLQQCASATGIPLSVLKGAKRKGCDGFKWTRVYLGPFLRWLFSKEGTDQGEIDHKREFWKYHALREKVAAQRDSGETLVKSEVHFALARGMSLLFGTLDRKATTEWPALLKGKEENQIKDELVGGVDEVKSEFKKAVSGLNGANGT